MTLASAAVNFELIGQEDGAQGYAFAPEFYCGSVETAAAYTAGFLKAQPGNPCALDWQRKHAALTPRCFAVGRVEGGAVVIETAQGTFRNGAPALLGQE